MKRVVTYLAIPIIFFMSSVAAFGQTVDKDKLLSFYQSQRYPEAVDYLQSVYGASPTDATAISQLAYCSFMAGSLSQAEAYYVSLQKLDPENLSIMFNLAKIANRRGNKDNAKTQLMSILKIDSTNFAVYKQLADVLTNSEERPLRLKYLQMANQLRPSDADVANDLAELYRNDKAYKAAYEILTIAIKADTLNTDLLKTKLTICLSLGNPREAMNTGERILAARDSGTFVLNTTARAAYQLADYKKAVKLLESVDPSFATEVTYYYITLCYQQLGKIKEAIASANKTLVVAISPNVANYYGLLGALTEINKQPLTAAAAYKKGLQFADHNSLFYNLGVLYDTTLKNKTQARSYYSKFISSAIDSVKYKRELAYARSRVIELKK